MQKNDFFLLRKLKNTESAQLWQIWPNWTPTPLASRTMTGAGTGCFWSTSQSSWCLWSCSRYSRGIPPSSSLLLLFNLFNAWRRKRQNLPSNKLNQTTRAVVFHPIIYIVYIVYIVWIQFIRRSSCEILAVICTNGLCSRGRGSNLHHS